MPTLLDYGERSLASGVVRGLLHSQQPDGSFRAADTGLSPIIETSQALRGLLAGEEFFAAVGPAACRAGDYLLSRMMAGGRGGFRGDGLSDAPESKYLYALASLSRLTETTGGAVYREAAERCLAYYSQRLGGLRPEMPTRHLGYESLALIELGRADLGTPGLIKARVHQEADGCVRATDSTQWTCALGLALLALCWYKIGEWDAGDRALAWLDKHQRDDGGFWGSVGEGAAYYPHAQVLRVSGYFLQAHRFRVRAFMRRFAPMMPSEVSPADGRAQAVLELVRSGDRVAEIGCGKGRFLKVIRRAYPETRCTGVDISAELLGELPEDIEGVQGSLERIPYAEDSFDVVFSVEAVEHSPHLEAAVAEMVRVARPGGWVAVIDKQRSQWGRLDCPSWERWPDARRLRRLLERQCCDVTYTAVSYDEHKADGLMLAWRGRKPLSPPSGRGKRATSRPEVVSGDDARGGPGTAVGYSSAGRGVDRDPIAIDRPPPSANPSKDRGWAAFSRKYWR